MSIRVLHGDMLAVLPTLDADSIHAPRCTDLAAGTAAEHLVCADLLLLGHRAFLADQNCPFDVAVESSGKLIRIQVKATRAFRRVPNRGYEAYLWHVKRTGKGGLKRYSEADFDILALAALDIRAIAYFSYRNVSKAIVQLRAPGGKTEHANRRHGCVDEYPFSSAIVDLAQ